MKTLKRIYSFVSEWISDNQLLQYWDIGTIVRSSNLTHNHYLNLTDPSYKSNPKWQYIGLTIVNRPYKKWALITAISIFSSGFIFWIIPFINPITSSLASIKFLGKFG